MNQEQQMERFLAGDSLFGGSQRAEIENFLKAGESPVYIGWGSMIAVSSEFMTRLAVSALKAVGRRGIILRGWAKLDSRLLDEQELIDYAKASVLFIETAPHEWLLPKCATNVVHGGSGTTAASMRSGKPTIITPVFLDQYDFADGVARLGNGIATCQFKSVTTKILADAIHKCLTDQQIRESAVEVRAKLLAENGVDVALQKIKGFVEGSMSSGEWLTKFERLQRERRSARDPNRWWASKVCCRERM